ncbi:MAG: hypothetical protein QOJ26_382, partial [Thermoplasmata archaeon]|nr:hypothetical protein [Thermoplasmata archaeon]
GGEPTIGADKEGALYVAGKEARVWRSLDEGKGWQDVSKRNLRVGIDPYVWVDRDATPSRVWSAPLFTPCGDIQWSDDGGATWSSSAKAALLPGCGAGLDHPSLVSGPAPPEVHASYQGRIAYYTYNSVGSQGGGWVARSLDGGETWVDAQRIFDGTCQRGYMGAPAVAPDGTVYIAKPWCDGLLVATSTDGGKAWTPRWINATGISGTPGDLGGGLVPGRRPDTYWTNPGVAVDPSGNAAVAWGGDDGRIHLSGSTDRGLTWSAPVAVSPPGITGTAFSAVTSLGEGRFAVAYLGTRHAAWAGHEAHAAPSDARWHLFVSFSNETLSPDPLFLTVQATPPEDPVQVGQIWQADGVPGNEPPSRNLRDFISIIESKGKVHVAYTDGCIRCDDAAQSTRQDLHVARIEGMPRAPVVGASPTPTPEPTASLWPVPSWTQPRAGGPHKETPAS